MTRNRNNTINREHQETFKDRQLEKGLVRVEVWIKEEYRKKVKYYEKLSKNETEK